MRYLVALGLIWGVLGGVALTVGFEKLGAEAVGFLQGVFEFLC